MPPVFQPDELPAGSTPGFEDETSGRGWVPLYSHGCTFGRDIFVDKMMNLIRNPNLNSSWLFRADILYDDCEDEDEDDDDKNDENNHVIKSTRSSLQLPADVAPIPRSIRNMTTQRTLVRTLIPRNQRRDKPLNQTCTFYQGPTSDLVIYAAHADSASALPFYHPAVRAVAHLHSWDPMVSESGLISILVLPFDQEGSDEENGCDGINLPPKVRRTAFHLLELLHKHGQSSAAGYVKRVHHDRIVPQARMQNRYAALKDKYARRLVEGWVESTDPLKHVFEDLAIAAFLIDLWSDMYDDDDGDSNTFPGFVDIGCGNGLLVYILAQEGYRGWGFDARSRKSWSLFRPSAHLEQRLLLPSAIARLDVESSPEQHHHHLVLDAKDSPAFHDGSFPPGTFIISNHADELTGWTPILAAASHCPFIAIPCCSHNLAGDRFRAPPPTSKNRLLPHASPSSSSSSSYSPPPSRSTYASLVDWVARIADDCGWFVEKEMLRIPSTRNTCLLGRRRRRGQDHGDGDVVHLDAVIADYGGCHGYRANLARLIHHTDTSQSH
ncbi:hypothetical protein CP532_6135 [Ophiocordyceps camponoti-leonardi (nom. inval.)]|nr:hypothetical protein CP532_6135 [Ophiocordyceps camponoti-leonardi (nom. inval.)]